MKKVKIAFTGPESSGKTTLAEWLSNYLCCKLINEYAREYLSEKSEYTIQDINSIAQEQFNRVFYQQEPLVIDTEMLVMKIWCEEKYQQCSNSILSLLEKQKIDFYFLCKPDIPWVDDPLRENPNDRGRLFLKYEKNLCEQNCSYSVLTGSLEARKNKIIETLQSLSWL